MGSAAGHSGRRGSPSGAGGAERWAGRPVIGPPEGSPHARGCWIWLDPRGSPRSLTVGEWEPVYGRPAEAQARWEKAHGRPLPDPVGGSR